MSKGSPTPAGTSGTTVAGDDFERHVKVLVEEILGRRMTHSPLPHSAGGTVVGMLVTVYYVVVLGLS